MFGLQNKTDGDIIDRRAFMYFQLNPNSIYLSTMMAHNGIFKLWNMIFNQLDRITKMVYKGMFLFHNPHVICPNGLP